MRINNSLRISIAAVLCLVWTGCCHQGAEAPGGIKHVFVIGIDAMSARGLTEARTPNMNYLMENGVVCRNVRTVIPSSSSPNWASMLMGAGPETHGVTSNDWRPDDYAVHPLAVTEYDMFPTIVSVVKKQLPAGKIGMIYHWSGFGNLFEKNVADADKSYPTQQETTTALAQYIRQEKPVFTFTQLDDVDHVGHSAGHMTDTYLQAIQQADSCVGVIFRAIREAGLEKESLVMVVADHGGIGYGHGGTTVDEMTVSFILYGKGVKKGVEINSPIHIFDVAPTVAFALGIEAPSVWTGRPIKPAFEGLGLPAEPFAIRAPGQEPLINGGRKMYDQAGGLFIDREAQVSIEPAAAGDTVYYTLDGTPPTRRSALYTAPFPLRTTTVVKARAYGSGGRESAIATGYFRMLEKNPANGVKVSYYRGSNWNRLPAFEKEKKCLEEYTEEIRLDYDRVAEVITDENSTFAALYSTSLQIDEGGIYTFYLQSDDGSRLSVDGRTVVDNDGGHGLIEKQGSIELSPGRHALEVAYFNRSGAYWVEAFYKSATLPKQIIPAEKLFKP